jgi:hypothetical protein
MRSQERVWDDVCVGGGGRFNEEGSNAAHNLDGVHLSTPPPRPCCLRYGQVPNSHGAYPRMYPRPLHFRQGASRAQELKVCHRGTWTQPAPIPLGFCHRLPWTGAWSAGVWSAKAEQNRVPHTCDAHQQIIVPCVCKSGPDPNENPK